ncbi:MAG: hypothetical protein ACRD9R_10405 [Pyrinomonadaceae bacterium]
MYCPQCGQQQVSDNTRFCSGCGLPISELAGWLAGGGALVGREAEAPAALPSPQRKGIRRGAKLMFLSAVLLPIFLGLSFLADHPVPLFVPFTIFLAGLSLLLYSRIFGEEISPAKSQTARPSRLGATSSGHAALPPASNVWMNNVGGQQQQVRTAEMVKPPSVTEHTTKLLESD